jgi:hypothetical protein
LSEQEYLDAEEDSWMAFFQHTYMRTAFAVRITFFYQC